jgi:Ca-activated chloride channel family protein
MENQDKIYKQFQQATKDAETKPVPGLDKIWARVEEKLDKKEEKKPVFWWRKLAVAASLLLAMTLGYQLFSDEEVILPTTNSVVESPKEVETVVPNKSKTTEEKAEEVIAPTKTFDANTTAKILKKDQQKSVVAVVETTVELKDDVAKKEIQSAAEITVSSVVLEENNLETKTSFVSAEVITNTITGEKTINGIVTYKSDGLTIPGVNVLIKATSKGVQTDFDGKFTIKAKLGDQLVFSYLGFKDSIVTISKKENIVVALEDDSSNLDAVVVMGYNVSRDGKVQSKEIAYRDGDKKSKSNNIVQQTLQGQVAGLNSTTGLGQLGSTNSVVIRGVSSLQKGTDILFIGDGVPVSENQFRGLNANDIKM